MGHWDHRHHYQNFNPGFNRPIVILNQNSGIGLNRFALQQNLLRQNYWMGREAAADRGSLEGAVIGGIGGFLAGNLIENATDDGSGDGGSGMLPVATAAIGALAGGAIGRESAVGNYNQQFFMRRAFF